MACVGIPCKHCGAFEIRSEIYYVCFKCGKPLDGKSTKAYESSEELVKKETKKEEPVKKKEPIKEEETEGLW